MPKIEATYEKDKLPEGLKDFAIEKDGKMVIDFDDSVALATNTALATKNSQLLGEKKAVQDKYDALVASSAEISREVLELRNKVASGGQVTADELAIVQAVKGIENVTPDHIKKMVEEYPQLQAMVAQFGIDAENRTIAEVMGWKPNVFGDLRNHPEKSKGLKFEISDVTENGKTVKKVLVGHKDASGADVKTDLAEFVKSNSSWNEYLPSLQVETKSTGPTWVASSQAGGSTVPDPATNPVMAHIQAKNEKAKQSGNALRPAQPPTPTVAPPTT